MENASKALIMAGSVIIAIGIISLALYVYLRYSDFVRVSEQLLTVSQIESFNRFYDSYKNGAGTTRGGIDYYEIRGIDYLNIYKKAVEDKTYDESLVITVDTSKLNEVKADSALFIEDDYYCGFKYNSQGKISEIHLKYNL